MSVDVKLYGPDLFGGSMAPPPESDLSARFGEPPFSVLDGRKGSWLQRKRAWTRYGLQGEVGREGVAAYDNEQWFNDKGAGGAAGNAGLSIFDPVLCERVYQWFSAPGAQVVDPFAGGPPRGIVAALTGRRYWGCDLRQEQISANYDQSTKLLKGTPHALLPHWVAGDSMDELEHAPEADLIFSCPPYGNLERYSEDERDLSTMDFHAFRFAYRRIIMRAINCLKDNRFACFVVGDFRDSRGFYRNFVGETIKGFEEAGARLYNEIILVTPVGSAAMRASAQFPNGRKVCKTHQNVLVFCKGNPKLASEACGEIVI